MALDAFTQSDESIFEGKGTPVQNEILKKYHKLCKQGYASCLRFQLIDIRINEDFTKEISILFNSVLNAYGLGLIEMDQADEGYVGDNYEWVNIVHKHLLIVALRE